MGLLHMMAENKGSDGNIIAEAEDQRTTQRSGIIVESAKAYDNGRWQGQSYTDRWPKLAEDFESEDADKQYLAALTINAIEETRKLYDNHRRLYGEAVVQASLGALNPRVLDVVRIFYPLH